jgi:hypothetical protein
MERSDRKLELICQLHEQDKLNMYAKTEEKDTYTDDIIEIYSFITVVCDLAWKCETP